MCVFLVIIATNIVLGPFLLPMALLVMGVLKSVGSVFDPLYLYSQVRKIRKEYSLFMLGLICICSLLLS